MKRLALIVFVVALRLLAAEGEHEPGENASLGINPEAPPKASSLAFPCDLTKGPNPSFRLIQADSKSEEGLTLDLLKRSGTGEIYYAFENPRGGSVADYIKANEPEADSAKATLFSSDDGFVQGLLDSTTQYVNLRRAPRL